VLRQRLREAKTYHEWKEAALTMDDYLGFNDWKKVQFGHTRREDEGSPQDQEQEDPYYDYLLVKKVLPSYPLDRLPRS